ncbi:MAG: helix-turn-helix domain-containing protein, partial [Acidimicrobiales bacterium]
MARPLKGGLRLARGRWWASVPDKTAASGRRYESFLAEDDARAWLAQAVPALVAGRPLPDAEWFRTTKPVSRTRPATRPAPAKIQPDVATVAKAWMAAAYEDLRRGGPDRAERVRRIVDGYLVPWFAPRTTTVADVTYYMAHDWLLHLVGREPPAKTGSVPAASALATSIGTDGGSEELTLAEVARLSGMSLPTVRRRWRDGELPGAYRNPRGHIRVPMSALDSVRNKRQAPI